MQLIGIVVGVPIMWVAARCQPRLFRAVAYPLLAVSAIGLCLILIPGVGAVGERRHPVDRHRAR